MIEFKLDAIKNALLVNTLHSSRTASNTRGMGNRPIIINLDGKQIMEVTEGHRNRAMRSGKYLHEL